MLGKPILGSVVMMGLLAIFGINLAGSSSTGYYSVPPADFTDINGNLCTILNDGYLLQTNWGTGCDFVTGVHLPDGVTVTKITMYWFDSTENYNITAYLGRSTYDGYVVDQLAPISSTLSGDGSASSYAITSIPIDNANYQYYIRLSMPSDQLQLIGFRIEYTNQSFLSLIKR